MSGPFDDSADELAAGRGEIDTTASPDWLILSGSSARALQLYMLLKLRLNRRRRGRKVWPGLALLAVMMKLKTSESVSPYIKELETLGAIDVARIGQTKHNIYRINFTPPPGYTGPMCIEDWDDDPAPKAAAQRIRDAERVKRDKTRGRTTAKQQVSGEPGKKPDHLRAGKTDLPDPGKKPDQEPGKNQDHDPGFFGVEPLGVDVVGKGTLRTTPSSSEPDQNRSEPTAEEEPDLPSELPNQETGETFESMKKPQVLPVLTEWEQALLEEAVSVGHIGWEELPVRRVLGSQRVREVTARNPELVRAAFLLGARDRGTVPYRMWHVDHCPHWGRAERALAAERSGDAAPADDVPAAGGSAGTDGAPRAAGAGMYVGPVGGRQSMPAQRSERSPDVAALFAQGGFRFGAEQETSAR